MQSTQTNTIKDKIYCISSCKELHTSWTAYFGSESNNLIRTTTWQVPSSLENGTSDERVFVLNVDIYWSCCWIQIDSAINH